MAEEDEDDLEAIVQIRKWVTCPYCQDVHDYGDADLPDGDTCVTCGNYYKIPSE